MLNTRRSLLISLVLHVILAIALMFVTLTHPPRRSEDSLEVSFTNPVVIRAPMQRFAPVEPPVWQMENPTEFDISPIKTTRRTLSSRARTPSRAIAQARQISNAISPNATNFPVTAEISAKNTSLLTRYTNTPAVIESGQFGEGLVTKTGVDHTSQGAVGGVAAQREELTNGGVALSARPSSSTKGIASLVSSTSDIANADSVLDDAARKVVLGDEVPTIPKGEPGGIIIGRGRNIKGRLNLVRLNDPLHPSVYG